MSRWMVPSGFYCPPAAVSAQRQNTTCLISHIMLKGFTTCNINIVDIMKHKFRIQNSYSYNNYVQDVKIYFQQYIRHSVTINQVMMATVKFERNAINTRNPRISNWFCFVQQLSFKEILIIYKGSCITRDIDRVFMPVSSCINRF